MAMESLADKVAKMTGGSGSDKRPPSPSLRTCPFCLNRCEFRPDWTCSGCGEKSTYHTDVSTCPDCGARRERRYSRNRLRTEKCDCDLTEEQKSFRREQVEIIERNRALDEKRRLEQIEQSNQDKVLRGEAEVCWTSSGYDCDEPRDHLPICRLCTRWESSSRLPTPGLVQVEEDAV